MASLPERDQPIITGTTLAVALVTIALLAFVIPPTLALWLHRSRLTRATDQIARTAAAFDRGCFQAAQIGGELANVDVLTGPGDTIEAPPDPMWASSRTASLIRCVGGDGMPLMPDPWLRPLLVNIAAAREHSAVWIISAGPNGILETPFYTAAAAAGDDVGRRIR